jgi:site-specific recombinase XerD
VWKIVKRCGRAAGLEITTHDFRHAKATTMLNNGTLLDLSDEPFGHASVSPTKLIYAHSTVRQLRQGFGRFSVRPENIA